ncbi:MAG: DUF1800 family protein [Cyanobacteria bacterium REEB67]|nr:DUF1800 family protein [Cyanobacteria bacterium REEB67]
MTVSRRTLLKAAVVAGGTLPLVGCERITSNVTKLLDETIPSEVATACGASVDSDFHLLSRATYGIWPGDLDRIKKQGRLAWLDEQIHPERIDDRACDLRARRFESLWLDPGTCMEFKKPFLRDELTRHALLRAVYSRRQLYEVMVGFWSDHLNIDVGKGDAIYAKPQDDRLVVRAHALGKFRSLIGASAISPAMLIYLDGKENRRPNADSIPNENYARELLELHTLGVDGGYTQKDVYEVARCLTGWSIHSPWQRGVVYFDPGQHDDGAKLVLGEKIAAGGGRRDLETVLDIACNHKSTARHIARKLAGHFVCEDPPPTLIDDLASAFTKSQGDIKTVISTLFTSQEFDQHHGAKIKRPFHFIASSLRSLAVDTYAHKDLTEYLNRLGHGPFQYPTPDGYPDKASYWTSNLLWRWNFALAISGNKVPDVNTDLVALATAVGAIPRTERHDSPPAEAKTSSNKPGYKINLDHLYAHFVGRIPDIAERKALAEYTDENNSPVEQQELIGLILSSPAFQRC